MTVFGGNLSAPASFTGVVMYRDLARQSAAVLAPWGWGLFPEGVTGPELSSNISGLDLGCIASNDMPGAAFIAGEHDYSVDTWRVDHKRFALTIAGDGATQTVNRFVSATREWGRYSGWSGTAPTFSDGGTDGYAEFTDDTSRFWSFAYGSNGGGGVTGALYYKIEVESGTFQIYDGDPTSGGTLRREITSGNNATEYACEFATTTTIYIRRKSGAAGPARLKSYKCYVKGSDCTGINFTVPDKTYAVSIPMTYSPNAALGGFGVGITFTAGATAKSNGTATLVLTDNTTGANRYLSYTGLRLNEKKFPSGGIVLSMPLPSGTTYGVAGIYNKQFLDDISRLGWQFGRTLDLSGANNALTFRSFPSAWVGGYNTRPTFGQTISAQQLALLANAAEWVAVWPTLPLWWSSAARIAYMTTLDTYLNPGVEIWAEVGNEVWNGGFGSNVLASTLATAQGIGTEQWYADRVHALCDDITTMALARTVRPMVCWQAVAGSAVYASLIGRRYNGGAGATLRTRVSALGGRYHTAPYFADGNQRSGSPANTGTLSFTTVSAVTGTGQTQATYYTEIARQYPLCQAESAAQFAVVAAYVAADNAANGTTIGFGTYEVNRSSYISGSEEANYLAAWEQYENSPAMGLLQKKHLTDISPNASYICWYSGIAGRSTGNNGYWNIQVRQGYSAAVNRTDSFEQIAAFGQSVLPPVAAKSGHRSIALRRRR